MANEKNNDRRDEQKRIEDGMDAEQILRSNPESRMRNRLFGKLMGVAPVSYPGDQINRN